MIGILFDLDGTLLDTLADLQAATNVALARFGYPPHTRDAVRRFVGNGAGLLIARAVPAGTDTASTEAVLAAFQAYYSAHCEDQTRPYPGIPEALARLSARYPLAIVSNKPDGAVKTLCASWFPGIPAFGETAVCPRKPAPDMLRRAMAQIGVTRCIYVGDSEVDVQTAQNAGVPCLSVLWGFRSREALQSAGAQSFCAAPADLPASIAELEESYGK